MTCTCCSPRRNARVSGTRYIDARVALAQAQRSYDEAFQNARGPWLQQAMDTYREAALKFLTWLEDEALAMNNAMLAAQEAAEQAGPARGAAAHSIPAPGGDRASRPYRAPRAELMPLGGVVTVSG